MTVARSPLDTAEAYLQNAVAPRANDIDRDPDALREALMGLGDRGLLALRADRPTLFRRFQETISRYSGALAFLQTQHQSAAAMLARSLNDRLKADYLPHLATGDRLVGVGFSHLRRSDNPPVRARAVPGGYRVEGFVPWITGWNFFDEFVIGAALPDGTALFGMMPLRSTEELGGDPQQGDGGQLSISEPMEMAALVSTNTVTADVRDWFIPDDRVLFLKPPNWIHSNSKTNVLHHSFFALGCARAGLDVLAIAAQKKDRPFLHTSFDRLDGELNDCRQQIFAADGEVVKSYGDRLNLRAWAIDLAGRCAFAAVSACSGASNSSQHPAQRVYREALVYAVSGQTTDVMEATLARLTERGN